MTSQDNSCSYTVSSDNDELDDLLIKKMNAPRSSTVDSNLNNDRTWEDVNREIKNVNDKYIKNANDKILLDTLAPQAEANEIKKRKHKDKLLTAVFIFLGIQFTVVFVLIMTMIVSIIFFHSMGNDFSLELVQMLFAFFSTYITSVVVELIFILKFIVEKVFDTSISSLMEIFKSQNMD